MLSAYNLSIKVPEATAAAIRAEYASGQKPSIRELAGRYGISHETVRKLVSRNATGAQNQWKAWHKKRRVKERKL